jgi:7-dehydrocholesterol reductase
VRPPVERLTTWAASSESPAVEWLRTALGPALILCVTPPLALLLWIVCNFAPFDGSLSPLFRAEGWRSVAAHWPWPTPSAALILFAFAFLEWALLRWLPGRDFEGPVTPSGVRPRYRKNGVAAWLVTHTLFLGASYGLGLFDAGIVFDQFGALLATLVLFALAFCLFLYAKGRRWPSSPDHGISGSFLWDYYWGVELHPRLFGVDLKQLVNCRLSMMGWSVIVWSFAAKQAALDPAAGVSTAMFVSAGLTVLYLFKFFWWESGYLASLDIMHDRFGYYICWGVLAWVPAVYALPVQYLVLHPSELPAPLAALLFAIGVAAIGLNYAADAQRQRVRATGGATTVWGKAPELIRAPYETRDGKRHESLLLVSGWWGVARHFHYLPELTLALMWSLPAGFTHFLPYVYVVFLSVLLCDRALRDEARCRRKYGTSWEIYCRRVPWRIVPGVY